jgi:hypothetical protein
MEHLFNSAVRVERMDLVVTDGDAVMDYAQATDEDPALDAMLQFLKCRLDMNFIRQGKDLPPAPVAGRAPDRIGVMFTYPYAPIKAGDRIIAIENEQGEIPVVGTFEIRYIPDEAVGFASRHHIEVQIIEVGQALTAGNWPAEELLPPIVPLPEDDD